MKILITGGNTEVNIDQVRVITNIFKGRTACDIAYCAAERGHEVTLIGNKKMLNDRAKFIEYRTYDELYFNMRIQITHGKYDAVIHSAAVSDYKIKKAFTANEYYGITPEHKLYLDDIETVPQGGKIGSNHKKLYLEFEPTEKIIDQIRGWGFNGTLIKFKLQVGITDQELITIAHKSRETSNANFIVANCLEWAKDRAYIIGEAFQYPVKRSKLADVLVNLVEQKK